MKPLIFRIADRLRKAETVTPELLSEVIRDACLRLPSVRHTKDYDRLERLIKSGAWTDATLALLALEAPHWQLRHIFFDSGEWHCTLSRQRLLPDWLDEPITACHADLRLAILSALLGAKHAEAATVADSSAGFSSLDPSHDDSFCCDNFS